jgi:hypothetical protein
MNARLIEQPTTSIIYRNVWPKPTAKNGFCHHRRRRSEPYGLVKRPSEPVQRVSNFIQQGSNRCEASSSPPRAEESAFPHLLHPRVYADFRKSEHYFHTALELLLSLYQIKPQDAVAVDLR